jgi:hypothetical protein
VIWVGVTPTSDAVLADDVCDDDVGVDDVCVGDVDALVLFFELLEHPATSNAVALNRAMILVGRARTWFPPKRDIITLLSQSTIVSSGEVTVKRGVLLPDHVAKPHRPSQVAT